MRYNKSTIIHHYLFGYELPDTVLLLTLDGQCVVLSAKRKCEFLEPAVDNVPEGGSVKSLKLLTRNKSDDNAENIEEMLAIAKGGSSGDDVKIGVLHKEFKTNDENAKEGSNLGGWEKALKADSSSEVVDITGGISLVMAVKDKETGEVSQHKVTVDRDECNRPGTVLEGLQALQPVREGGYVTAGNASQLSDGAAALVMMTRSVAVSRNGIAGNRSEQECRAATTGRAKS